MDTFTMIALLPHGNILALMEAERKKTIRAVNGDCTPFYPLVCPLCFYESGTHNTLTIRDFLALFQSHSRSPCIEVPVFEGNTIVRPVSFLPVDLPQQPHSFFECRLANRFTLRTNRFLYGTIDQKLQQQKNNTTKNKCEILPSLSFKPQPLRVFQLCEYECTAAMGNNSENAVFEWTEVKTVWVKT